VCSRAPLDGRASDVHDCTLNEELAWEGGGMVEGSWQVHTVDGADVRLRSGRIGLVSVDVSAPVSGGELVVAGQQARFTLRLALDQLKTRNFLMQAAARTLVTRHDAHVLTYEGTGPVTPSGWQVAGHAAAGDVDLELQLEVSAIGPDGDPMAEIEIVGSANVGTVHLPLPGLGTVEDFSFDVDARLMMRAQR
jgi:hypothetical protein